MKNLLMVCFVLTALAISSKPASAEAVLEPFTYTQNFETRELLAWASYPLWQDTAYDPNFIVNEMVPGDPNISIVQKVTPYTNVDNYAGAQKLLDMYLVEGSTISFRYYLKTNIPVEYFKVRLAAGLFGKVDYTVNSPELNKWVTLKVSFTDFVAENARLKGSARIKVNDLAFLAKIPKGDPKMPIYLGIDDVAVNGMRVMEFKFDEPKVTRLPEFKPYISMKHYLNGDMFTLSGKWPLDAKNVNISVVDFSNRNRVVFAGELKESDGVWALKPLKLTFGNGMYIAVLKAYNKDGQLAETEFSFIVAPAGLKGKHPRLLFDAAAKKDLDVKIKNEKYSKVVEGFTSQAKSWREKLIPSSVIYQADQFPDDDWLPTLGDWSRRTVGSWGDAVLENSLDYSFNGNREAGDYVVNLLMQLSTFPDWNHPWLANRGRFNYHPTGVMAHRFALGYDLTYNLMSDDQRKTIRKALIDKLIDGSFKTYVYGDEVTCDTSNWISHVVGGSLMCLAAIYGDGDEELEPYLSGHIFKMWDFIEHVHGPDGAYGEGYGYNGYTMMTMCESVPSLKNTLNIDLSAPINGSYQETVWAGIIKEKHLNFHFGDSSGNLNNIDNWAWLLPKFKDPLLGWYYNYVKTHESLNDVLYDTENVAKKDPFSDNPNRVFRSVGSTVFKSGWEPDDFVFVLRTGPFINHQHIDQGTFWLADKGQILIGERHGSTYYDDPKYQPWYTQPVGHSTILINGNHQSQRTGDHEYFADGFDDYAFVGHYLDGADAAFVQGDIGKLYWGDVESIQRNVLFIKPRTLLMLDTVKPAKKDADVTLLYQTEFLKGIVPGKDTSSIEKEGVKLYIKHITPDMTAKAVWTPHYLYTYNGDKPLQKEGMLTLTARTSGKTLVMANLLSTDNIEGDADKGDGFFAGAINGFVCAFSAEPGKVFKNGAFSTDAAAYGVKNGKVFAALCKVMSMDGAVVYESNEPCTFETVPGKPSTFKFYIAKSSPVSIGSSAKPSSITLNGAKTKDFSYDSAAKTVKLTLPEGDGNVTFVY